MKILLYIFLGLFFVGLALPNFISCGDRPKSTSVKSNMHTFQTIVETYSVDYPGLYAKNVENLNKASKTASNKYWKDFNNPYTGKTGKGISYDNFDKNIILDEQGWYNYFFPKKYPAGMVYYDPVIDGKNITKYYIYGSYANGKLIRDSNGMLLTLSNN
ncbi:MAG: hypothetical protein U0457_14555 [Candidatus Sericytochromatia bacterium]